MARKRLSTRSIVVGIVVAGFAIFASTTRTKPFDCAKYLSTNNSSEINDPRVLGCRFQKHIDDETFASISQEGRIQRDTDTFFWSLFATAFAANPNTPYLYTTLPLISFGGWSWLPSPMWRIIDKRDVAVFIGRLPPKTVYMGFTTFALWKPFSLVFASLGDSSNQINLKHDPKTGLFAYVICFANEEGAYKDVMDALVATGLPENAINVQALNSELTPSKWTYYELVLRIFHFKNQTEGSLYLDSQSHDHPFYYVSADDENQRNQHKDDSNSSTQTCSVPSKPTGFKTTFHSENMNEKEKLAPSFVKYGNDVLTELYSILSTKPDLDDRSAVTSNDMPLNYTNHSFGVLHVADGTNCLRYDTECLGGCPDAAYFGLNVNTTKDFQALALSLNELHVVTLVDHRVLNNSIYSSLALLTSNTKVLNPQHLTKNVRATSVGITSPDLFGETNRMMTNKEENDDNLPSLPFATWIFTRNRNHCKLLNHLRYGCTVIDSSHDSSNNYVTYLERIYLNPLTGTRPDYDNILPARLYRVILDGESKETKSPVSVTTLQSKERISAIEDLPNLPFSKIKLPPSQPFIIRNEPMRFLHIIKTGGESLENYVWKEPSLKMDYSACVATAAKATNASLFDGQSLCNALATLTSKALCGLNCECCASDMFLQQDMGFHGTLLRSPRAHVLSQFSHCHTAHHTTIGRILRDVPLFAAESILRMTEEACCSSCDVEGNPDWLTALENRLSTDERNILPYYSNNKDERNDDESSSDDADRVLVISIHNTQSHALTCGKQKGSFGHHFRRITTENVNPIDEYTPSLQDALSTLEKFEWFGITELFMSSLCLLHYQTNQVLPPQCDCDSLSFVQHDSEHALGYWKETRSQRRKVDDPNILRKIDEHTRVDAALYAQAVRIFLGRLRSVEKTTGTSLLKCIQWNKFRAKTEYLDGLWNDGPNGLLV